VSAADELLPLVYRELRGLAAAKLAKQRPGETLHPTMLVHEAYLRLVDVDQPQHWNSRGHFFGAAAEAMRRILVEKARQKKSQKRAHVVEHGAVDELAEIAPVSSLDLIALDDALTAFEQQWPEKAQLVKLRYFDGLAPNEADESHELTYIDIDTFLASF
jgi:RNA polymerase sigma factor (TIGR02999 family)